MKEGEREPGLSQKVLSGGGEKEILVPLLHLPNKRIKSKKRKSKRRAEAANLIKPLLSRLFIAEMFVRKYFDLINIVEESIANSSN